MGPASFDRQVAGEGKGDLQSRCAFKTELKLKRDKMT